MKRHRWSVGLLAACMGLATHALAGPVNGLTTFSAGTPARAAEVNGNFVSVKTAVDDNNTRINALLAQMTTVQTQLANLQNTAQSQAATITTLQGTVQSQGATITALQGTVQAQASTISTLQGTVQTQASTLASLQTASQSQSSSLATLQGQLTNITPLNGVVSLSSIGGLPTVRFTNVNVQVVNGQGQTASVNGTGNLIVGYNETRPSGVTECSIGSHPTSGAIVTSSLTCTAAGGTMALNHKSGSHNLIVGDRHNYGSYGGAAFGTRNTINFRHATVVGGSANASSGFATVIAGGTENLVWGNQASISGGFDNQASGDQASVSGGQLGAAVGDFSSVSGGRAGYAGGEGSSVTGGAVNYAEGVESVVSGGQNNAASGLWSTVSGGNGRTAPNTSNWRAGGLLEAQ